MDKLLFESGSNKITITNTPWDQKVINKKSCEIKFQLGDNISNFEELFQQVNDYLESHGYEYTQIRCDSNNKFLREILLNYGYSIAEMSYSLEYANPEKLDTSLLNRFNIELVRLDKSDQDAIAVIKEIAFNDFNHGRLFEDINIREELSRQRCANWIDDLLKEPFHLYKAMFRGTLIGFHAEKFDESSERVDWILTGVSSKHSVYALPLWCSAFELAKSNKIKSISTMISASNTKVLNLYNRFPFRVSGSWYGFHKLKGKIK